MNRVSGNLLDLAYQGEFDIIVHGANCFNKMASGIAGQIAKRFPEAAEADNLTLPGDKGKLGHYTYAKVEGAGHHNFYIFNAYTQYTYGRGQDVFEYDHFDRFLKGFSLCLLCSTRNLRVGFPYIGCGLAGGDESRIVEKIEKFSKVVEKTATVSLVKLGN